MEESKVRAYILAHLLENPQACDTVEGIARWWLVSQQVSHSVMAVKEALGQLKAEGLIVERETGGGVPVYSASGIEV